MDLQRLVGSRAVFTRTLLACYGITAAIHLASLLLNTLLPFHVVALGGSKTQVGLLFSVMTVVSMFLRPLVGGFSRSFSLRSFWWSCPASGRAPRARPATFWSPRR